MTALSIGPASSSVSIRSIWLVIAKEASVPVSDCSVQPAAINRGVLHNKSAFFFIMTICSRNEHAEARGMRVNFCTQRRLDAGLSFQSRCARALNQQKLKSARYRLTQEPFSMTDVKITKPRKHYHDIDGARSVLMFLSVALHAGTVYAPARP